MSTVRKARLDLPAVADAVLNVPSPGNLAVDRATAVEACADLTGTRNLPLDRLPGVKRRLLARRLVKLRLSLSSVHAVLQARLLRQVETLPERIPNAVDLLPGDAERRLLRVLLEVQKLLLSRAERRGLRIAARLRGVSAPKDRTVRAASADLVEALLFLRRRYVGCGLRACDDGGICRGRGLRR